MAKKGKAPKSFEEKVDAKFPGFVSEVIGLSADQLKTRLGEIAKALQENEDKRDADEELGDAKALAKELGEAYSGPKKDFKMKTKYLVKLIQEKGGE